MLLRIHHRNSFLCAVNGGKSSVPDLVLFINILPLSIEQNGVDQIHYGVGINTINDFLYLAVGILLYPVVDIPQRFPIERRFVCRSTVVIRVFLQKSLFRRKSVIPEPNRICDIQL